MASHVKFTKKRVIEMRKTSLFILSGLVGLFALVGCGEDGGTDDGEAFDCDHQRTVLGFEEVSELGFSADDLFDEIPNSGDADLDWTKEGATTNLSWSFSPDQEEAYLVEEVPAEGEDQEAACSDVFLAVGGTLEMSTADDKIDETVEAELTAESTTVADIAEAVSFAQMGGTLEIDGANAEDLIRINGEITENGYSGLLAHDPYSEDEDSSTDGAWDLLAEWEPSEGEEFSDCEFNETDLSFDEEAPIGFSADDVLSGISLADSTVLDWSDGGDTVLTWSFSQDSDEIHFLQESPTNPDSGAVCESEFISIGGTLELETEDGQLEEDFMVELLAEAVDITELTRNISVSDINGGLSGEQMSDDDVIKLEATIDADGSYGKILLDRYDESSDGITDSPLQPLGEWSNDS